MIFFTFFAYDIVKFNSLSFFFFSQMKINDYYFGSFARETLTSCAAVPGADLYLIPLFFLLRRASSPPEGSLPLRQRLIESASAAASFRIDRAAVAATTRAYDAN